MIHRKILIHGASGSGKTTFLGTAQSDPRVMPMIVFDFEGGALALEGTALTV